MTNRATRNGWNLATLSLAMLVTALILLDRWPQETSTDRLTNADAQQLATIRVERNDQLRLAFLRENGSWQMTFPSQQSVSVDRVGQLLAITQAPVRYRFDADANLARYGLDAPNAMLQVDDTTLLFGNREPTQEGRYVQVNDQVAVIDEVYFNLLLLPASHFVAD